MSKTRILVVEDEVIAGEALVDKLVAMGYVVAAHATSGEEAIEQAEKASPDVVLMDIRLGGSLDGIDAAAKIQERMDLPIIYLTAFTDEEILQKAKITAPYSYLIKPVRDRELQIVIDIALHRHRLESRLKERERWLNTVLRSIGDAVITTDAQGKVTFMNPVAEQLTGWTKDEAIGHDLDQIFHIINEETRARVVSPASRALRQGRIVGLANHTILLRRNGDELHIDDSAAPLEDDHGHLTGAVLIFRDITDKRQNELALIERTLELGSIFSNAPLGILHINRHGIVINANKRLVDIMGLTQREIEGTSADKIPLNKELRGTLLQALHGESTVYEGEHTNVEGTRTRFIRALFNPVRLGLSSSSVDVIATVEDISDRKRMESDLRIAKEMAEASNRAKSVFLANMSHELRTPLNAILGYAQLFQRRRLDPDILKGVKTIQKSGEHLLMLINDILNMAKIEAGKLDLHPTPIHFRSFLENLAALIQSRTVVKGLIFAFEAPDNLPSGIIVDETRLREILLNLLDNAIKFTQKGCVTLRVLSRDDDRLTKGKHPTLTSLLRFEVEDTGIGIEPDQLEKIFEPFVQTSKTAHFIEGTGLGLAISRQLVELMHGNLQVKSVLGQGSLFWFEVTLPVTEMIVEEVAPQSRIIAGYQGRRRRVLVADDIPSNRAVLLDLLKPLGFDICEAADGRQAVQIAQDKRPDLILMDRYMPVMDGFEATLQIRQIPELGDVAIIALSAGVSEEDQVSSQTACYDAFLSKPFQWPKLAALIEQLLKLEWDYKDNSAETPVAAHSTEHILERLVPPPREELLKLLDLARRGDLSAIPKWTTRLKMMSEDYVPFANKLCDLAQGFEEQKILDLTQHYLGPGP